MVLVVASVVAVIALMQGGSLANLAATKFGWVWVLMIALALQIEADIFAPANLPRDVAIRLLVVTYFGCALFMGLNRKLPGMPIAAIGLVLNAVVIFLNDAMPVSRWAAEIAGAGLGQDLGVKHEVAGPDTVLPFLADVIPLPNTLQIVSIGDVILALGIGVLIYRRTMAGRQETVVTTASY